eukprot:2648608-Amphidinium_carterae.1
MPLVAQDAKGQHFIAFQGKGWQQSWQAYFHLACSPKSFSTPSSRIPTQIPADGTPVVVTGLPPPASLAPHIDCVGPGVDAVSLLAPSMLGTLTLLPEPKPISWQYEDRRCDPAAGGQPPGSYCSHLSSTSDMCASYVERMTGIKA